MDKTALDTNLKEFIAEFKALGRDPTETYKDKVIQIEYRGVMVSNVPVATPVEEYRIVVETYVRSVAVDKGILDSIWCENDLCNNPPRPAVTFEIAADLVKCTKAARSTLKDFLSDTDATLENIKDILAQKVAFLVSTDPWCRIEIGFWDSFGGNLGIAKMEDAILKCLPIPGVYMSAASSLSELRKLGASMLLQFCGMAMQCVYNNV